MIIRTGLKPKVSHPRVYPVRQEMAVDFGTINIDVNPESTLRTHEVWTVEFDNRVVMTTEAPKVTTQRVDFDCPEDLYDKYLEYAMRDHRVPEDAQIVRKSDYLFGNVSKCEITWYEVAL